LDLKKKRSYAFCGKKHCSGQKEVDMKASREFGDLILNVATTLIIIFIPCVQRKPFWAT
jgi:hypothetical protein